MPNNTHIEPREVAAKVEQEINDSPPKVLCQVRTVRHPHVCDDFAVSVCSMAFFPAEKGVATLDIRIFSRLEGQVIVRLVVLAFGVHELVRVAHDGSIANVRVRLDARFERRNTCITTPEIEVVLRFASLDNSATIFTTMLLVNPQSLLQHIFGLSALHVRCCTVQDATGCHVLFPRLVQRQRVARQFVVERTPVNPFDPSPTL